MRASMKRHVATCIQSEASTAAAIAGHTHCLPSSTCPHRVVYDSAPGEMAVLVILGAHCVVNATLYLLFFVTSLLLLRCCYNTAHSCFAPALPALSSLTASS